MTLPSHIAFILDGNRRWARQRGLTTFAGHRASYENFKIIADECFKRGIKIVSAYVFSTENWNRSAREVGYLMKLLKRALIEETKELGSKGIRIKVLGLPTKLDAEIKKLIKQTETQTAHNTKGTINLCLNYGGRAEIVETVKNIINKKIPIQKINEKTISDNLWTAGQQDPDFVIRTSGEMRLSGFLPWQSVYSELYFPTKMWPEFGVKDLDKALKEYSNRQRRFGGNG